MMSESTLRIDLERPLTSLQRAAEINRQVRERGAANGPANEEPANDNGEEAMNILPQEPARFSTMGICVAVFFGLFWAVGQFIIAPSIWLGLLFNAPNFGPVMSILAVLLWIFGYQFYLSRWYWPGRPWIPLLDSEGQPQLREVDERQFVYASCECGLPRVWKRTWVPIEAFPVAEEEAE